MTLDLDFDAQQAAIGDAVAQLCRDQGGDAVAREAAGRFPEVQWTALAELGVLDAGAPGTGTGALEALAIVESLGQAAFPGPICETLLAAQVLRGDERDALAAGTWRVAVADLAEARRGGATLVPWAPVADAFLLADAAAGRVYTAVATDAVHPVDTLGAEPWGRVTLEAGELLEGGARALAVFDALVAGWLAAAGQRLVHTAAEHARTRTQFGRAIGEFQAVAHPLADAHMALATAATLARAAACALDEQDLDDPQSTLPDAAVATAAAARISAREASLRAVHTAHQTFGAIGITLDGPIYIISRRVRQLASHPVGASGASERVASFLNNQGTAAAGPREVTAT